MNNIVRVTKDQNVQFGPVLEMHKFVGAISSQTLYDISGEWKLAEELPEECEGALKKLRRRRVPLVGIGPFVTVRLGGSEVVQSFGAGVMLGFRTAESDKSLNLGIAFVTDPSVRTLGDGIVEGQALPTGETQIRYKTTDMYGLMALFSVGW